MKYTYYIFLLCLSLSCTQDKSDLPLLEMVLSDYIATNETFPLVRDSLIACAFGGQNGFLENPTHPVSILFYPEGNATEFQYFETDSIAVNPDDLSNYQLQDLSLIHI